MSPRDDRRRRAVLLDHAAALDIAGHHDTAGLVLAIASGETDAWRASQSPADLEPVTEAELESMRILWWIFDAPAELV